MPDLKAYRKARKLSQEALGRLLGIDGRTIRRYECEGIPEHMICLVSLALIGLDTERDA